MFKHWIEIVHNHDNGYLDWLFHQNVFPLRESNNSIMSGNGKGFISHLRSYLEVHSLSSNQVLLSIQIKTFSKSNLLTFNFFSFELYLVYFIYLRSKSSYRVD